MMQRHIHLMPSIFTADLYQHQRFALLQYSSTIHEQLQDAEMTRTKMNSLLQSAKNNSNFL